MSVACVLIPHFMAQIEYQRQPAPRRHPLLLVGTRGSRRVVVDRSPQASGVYPGMALQQAMARLEAPVVLEADLAYYHEAFVHILDVLDLQSPLVEPAALGCAYVGLDGLEGIHQGHRPLLDSVAQFPEARVGVAAGKFPARVAALQAKAGKVLEVSQDVRGFLSRFKVEVLPVSGDMKERLGKFGLHTLGQVASLAPGPLQAQFGPEGRMAWELANGIDRRPVIPRKMEEVVQESLSFPSPANTLAPILTAAEILTGRAFSRPQLRGRYVRKVSVQAQVFRGGTWTKRIAFKEPVGDRNLAFFAIKSRLAEAKIPGPLEDVTLAFSSFTGESGRQESLFAEVRKWGQLTEAVRQLEARLGRKPPLYVVRDVEPWSRLPERRQALVPFDP